jgi:hypothetical protein
VKKEVRRTIVSETGEGIGLLGDVRRTSVAGACLFPLRSLSGEILTIGGLRGDVRLTVTGTTLTTDSNLLSLGCDCSSLGGGGYMPWSRWWRSDSHRVRRRRSPLSEEKQL